jgi:outer membrane protein insertion porin family
LTPEWKRELVESSTIANSWSIERNTLDYHRDPSSGARHELIGTVAGLGGDNNFFRLEHDSSWYAPLDDEKKWVLSFRTREGWAQEYGSSEFVPLSERFFAGGTATIRGYDNRDVGPKVQRFINSRSKEAIGGKLRLVNNLELKYKVTKILRLYAFLDYGGVWREPEDFAPGDIRFGSGIGFGVDIPRIGPVRVDYGVPLNPDKDQGTGRIHLMTGFRF